jgi:hypothetical protein
VTLAGGRDGARTSIEHAAHPREATFGTFCPNEISPAAIECETVEAVAHYARHSGLAVVVAKLRSHRADSFKESDTANTRVVPIASDYDQDSHSAAMSCERKPDHKFRLTDL